MSLKRKLHSVFSCEKALLDLIPDRKRIYKIAHSVLQSFVITKKARVFHLKILISESGAHRWENFNYFLWGDNLMSRNLKANFNCVLLTYPMSFICLF